MFLTRIGENSKIVVNGDPSQIDLPNKSMSGLVRSKELLGHLKEISVVDFDHSDVVRHPLVSKIVVNGDPTQIDLPNKNMSGLVRSKELLGHLNEIAVVDFDHSDVVRHPLVSKIVKAYSKND